MKLIKNMSLLVALLPTLAFAEPSNTSFSPDVITLLRAMSHCTADFSRLNQMGTVADVSATSDGNGNDAWTIGFVHGGGPFGPRPSKVSQLTIKSTIDRNLPVPADAGPIPVYSCVSTMAD
jgi:hypothetical protein